MTSPEPFKLEHTKALDARFTDVDLARAVFDDVNLRGASFRNVCLAGVTIDDANVDGLRIDGVLLTELLRAYRESQSR